MTTQDTGLVEVVAQAVLTRRTAPDFRERLVSTEDPLKSTWAVDHDLEIARTALTAILPHLSPESQALLRKELNGE